MAPLLICGCRHHASDDGSQTGTALTGNVRTYEVKGTVVASDLSTGEVTINSEAIPGFMEAMVMPYKLAQPGIASELHPGDHLQGRLRVSDSASLLDQIVVTEQAQPDYKPAVTYNAPTPGQEVPDFTLLNQSGKRIHIHQFRGKVLMITFVYTRCPLPDFCVRMSRNFAKIDQALAKNPKLYAKTHLLTISFDPAYDTPKVLRSYGGAYTGRYSKETFTHWDFAVPPKSELKKVDEFFDVGVTPGDGGTLTHSLSTVVVAADGKIAKWYPSNQWQPSDVLGVVKTLLEPAPVNAGASPKQGS
jgi:protein SCO1/2